MPDVGDEDVLEVATAKDQQPIEAFAPDASDPTLGVRPRIRCPYRRFDHPDPFRAEDVVELAAELAVAIRNQKPRPDVRIVELHQRVARLLSDPRPLGW